MADYLDRVTAYVCRTAFDDLPVEVVMRSKEVLADTLAVIAAGAQEDEVKKLRDRLIAQGGRRIATMIGTGHEE